MNEQVLEPKRITKPIQLLAAWLAGLLSIDSCFLFAASRLQAGSWESGALTVAAIVNVPLFLVAVFLLQTKFRPELQEDLYYSNYLSRKSNEPINISKEDAHLIQIQQRLDQIETSIVRSFNQEQIADKSLPLFELKVGVNTHLGDAAALSKKLSECGVQGYSSFGTKNPPEQRVVGLSEYLSKDLARKVIEIARQTGFSHYTYFDNRMEDTEEDVLFGAYGKGEYEITHQKSS
jgi:hypothetical protein